MIDEDLKGKYERGLRAFRNKEYETAIEFFSAAVEYDENNDKAWNALGTACAKVGRYADADLCYENALTLQPGNDTYLKNRITNAKHLKSPPNLPDRKGESLLDRLPFDKIPVDRRYILAGAGLFAAVIFAIAIYIAFFSAPPIPPGPPLLLSVNQTGGSIFLTNNGGSEIGSIASFSWKINGKDIGTGTPGDPATLSPEPGSIAIVPLADIADTNPGNGMEVMVIANYKDGGSLLALSSTLPPPSPDLLAAITPEISPNATPTPPPRENKFSAGEIVVDDTTGSWWVVMSPPANNTYVISHAARAMNGTFLPVEEITASVSADSFEETGRSVGMQGAGGTQAGIPAASPPPVTGVPVMHPEPVFVAGDLVNSADGTDSGMIVILGYDPATDQYQADAISRYYSGEWGYRETSTPNWFLRESIERQFSHRIDRITLSDVGIGHDSAPPRRPVKYQPGSIISPDKAGIDNLVIITAYTQADDSYTMDTVRSAFGGGWIMSGEAHSEKRAFVERDYPYLIRTVDLSLVQTR